MFGCLLPIHPQYKSSKQQLRQDILLELNLLQLVDNHKKPLHSVRNSFWSFAQRYFFIIYEQCSSRPKLKPHALGVRHDFFAVKHLQDFYNSLDTFVADGKWYSATKTQLLYVQILANCYELYSYWSAIRFSVSVSSYRYSDPKVTLQTILLSSTLFYLLNISLGMTEHFWSNVVYLSFQW